MQTGMSHKQTYIHAQLRWLASFLTALPQVEYQIHLDNSRFPALLQAGASVEIEIAFAVSIGNDSLFVRGSQVYGALEAGQDVA